MKTMAILIMILSLINMINEFDVAYKENDGGDNENSDDRVSDTLKYITSIRRSWKQTSLKSSNLFFKHKCKQKYQLFFYFNAEGEGGDYFKDGENGDSCL